MYTAEIINELGTRIEKLLDDIGYRNVKVKIGSGFRGWQEHSPLYALIVTCDPSSIPKPLTNLLVEGLKMIIPVGETFAQQLVLMTKEKGIRHDPVQISLCRLKERA